MRCPFAVVLYERRGSQAKALCGVSYMAATRERNSFASKASSCCGTPIAIFFRRKSCGDLEHGVGDYSVPNPRSEYPEHVHQMYLAEPVPYRADVCSRAAYILIRRGFGVQRCV